VKLNYHELRFKGSGVGDEGIGLSPS